MIAGLTANGFTFTDHPLVAALTILHFETLLTFASIRSHTLAKGGAILLANWFAELNALRGQFHLVARLTLTLLGCQTLGILGTTLAADGFALRSLLAPLETLLTNTTIKRSAVGIFMTGGFANRFTFLIIV